MKKSTIYALIILCAIILGSLIGIIIAQQQSINKTENQKLYDKAYIEGYNKGFDAGAKKTVETFDSIRNSKKKISSNLEDKAIKIISELKEVKELKDYNAKFDRKIIYFTVDKTKEYVEIKVAVDVKSENRVATFSFYKYYSTGELFKLDILNNIYKSIN